jgi:hypothetical protein
MSAVLYNIISLVVIKMPPPPQIKPRKEAKEGREGKESNHDRKEEGNCAEI